LLGYRRIRPRNWPYKKDAEKIADFIEFLSSISKKRGIDIWYQDECGVTGDPVIRKQWAPKGSRPLRYYSGNHIKYNIIGAMRSRDGRLVSHVVPEVNKEYFQLFINEMQKQVIRGKRIYLIMDNANWHKSPSIKWGKITPIYLPPYSPDLNPIEILWRKLKDNYFSIYFTKDYCKLLNRVSKAIRYYINHPSECQSVCMAKSN